MAEDIKESALTFADTLAESRKKHGVNSLMTASAATSLKVTRLASGIPALDYQLGGGIPLGRSIHISGKEHSGKTYLAMVLVAAIQRMFPKQHAMWLDYEHTFDCVRASHVGVDLDRLLISQPIVAEEAFDQVIEMLPFISCMVTDSVAAINPESETEEGMGKKQMGASAGVMSKFYRLWNTAIAPEHHSGDIPTIILCNQVRDNLKPFGKETTFPGGRAVRHNCSVFIETKRGPIFKLKELDPEGEAIVIGHEVEFAVTKNNTFQPDKKGTFLLCTRPYAAAGYPVEVNQTDWPRDLLKYAVYYGILQKNGAHHYYGDAHVGKSQFAAQKRLFEDA